jgi:Protein of unknown function (DUF2799)
MRSHPTLPWFLIPVLVCALAASGCSTLSKSECLVADWESVGYTDGVGGYSGDRIAQHRKACAKHGVAPDLALYQAGRQTGLREFCQPANGYRLGTNGYNYTGVCAGELEPAFLSSYQSGHQLYVLQSKVSNATNQIESRRAELSRIEGSIVKKSALIISSEATEEQRAQALVDTKQMAERAGKLKQEIRQLEEDRVHYQRDLDEYRATLQLGT